MNNRKETILLKALELYLTRGYAGVSISVLQKELGMGRATMYYYFKDKDALFLEVVHHYYIEPLRKNLDLPDSILLDEMIQSRLESRNRKQQFFQELDNANISNSNLQSLFLFAVVRFPALGEEVGELKKREYHLWKQSILNSKAAGEIRQETDEDKLALTFTSLKEMGDFSVFINHNYEDRFLGTLQYIYNLIKL